MTVLRNSCSKSETSALKAKQLETMEPSPKQFKEPDAEESPMKPRLSIKESLKKCSEESPKSETKPKTNSKWETFPVAQWQDAVYKNRAYFGQLCTDTSQFITEFAEDIKLGGSRVSLIEVGCGTGEFIRDMSDSFRVAVGLDFNPMFIEYCKTQTPKGMESRERYVQGDACQLVKEMKRHFPKKEGLLWNDTRIVACVGNTIGIIPQEMKQQVYEQMFDLAGEKGVVIMAYWSADWFGDAVQNFYHANPDLCGAFTGDCIDLKTTTLKTPSGYCTHWTSLEEARGLMEGLGAEIISIKSMGKGVLVAARRLPKQHRPEVSVLPQVFTVAKAAPEEKTEEKKPEAKEEETAATKNSKWETFPVAQWQDAVYTNRAYFGQLCIDTSNFITNIAETIKLSGSRVSLVEVGCGTGEFVRDIAGNFRVAVGLDFNPMFIEYCSQQVPKSRQDQERYVRGDATKLVEEMEQHFPKKDGLLWNDTRIVACVGNTIGIIPQEMKAKVYEQMLELAGENGVVIMAYWSAAWFGDAVQNFYHANPKLCGPFTGDCIDLGTCTLKTPSGYCTHWTSVQEARDVMEGFGAEIISIKHMGKGVLVAARKLKKEM